MEKNCRLIAIFGGINAEYRTRYFAAHRRISPAHRRISLAHRRSSPAPANKMHEFVNVGQVYSASSLLKLPEHCCPYCVSVSLFAQAVFSPEYLARRYILYLYNNSDRSMLEYIIARAGKKSKRLTTLANKKKNRLLKDLLAPRLLQSISNNLDR